MPSQQQYRLQLAMLDEALRVSPEFRNRPEALVYHRGPKQLLLQVSGHGAQSASWSAAFGPGEPLRYVEFGPAGPCTPPADFEIDAALRSALRFITAVTRQLIHSQATASALDGHEGDIA